VRSIVLLLAAAILSAAALKFLPVPWLWLLTAWFVALAILAALARANWQMVIAISVATVVATLAAFECFGFYSMTATPVVNRTFSDGYKTMDPVLGSAPVRGSVGRSTLTDRGRVVYDVRYTIGANGLRIAPPVAAAPLQGCILFFGDSFTFGEGLQDVQTVPYLVGLKTAGRYRIYNFSFHGYGAQQMLANLQHGLYRQIVDCAPSHVIYQALADHPARAAGLYSWTDGSPRYVLRPDGTVAQQGHFGDHSDNKYGSAPAANIRYQLGKSYFVQWIRKRHRTATLEDVRLWSGIVNASRNIVAKDFPGAHFDVILWGERDRAADAQRNATAMRDLLQSNGIRFHSAESLLPHYELQHPRYELDQMDAHPNAAANELIADFIVKSVLQIASTR
jgi:hypothetical protein